MRNLDAGYYLTERIKVTDQGDVSTDENGLVKGELTLVAKINVGERGCLRVPVEKWNVYLPRDLPYVTLSTSLAKAMPESVEGKSFQPTTQQIQKLAELLKIAGGRLTRARKELPVEINPEHALDLSGQILATLPNTGLLEIKLANKFCLGNAEVFIARGPACLMLSASLQDMVWTLIGLGIIDASFLAGPEDKQSIHVETFPYLVYSPDLRDSTSLAVPRLILLLFLSNQGKIVIITDDQNLEQHLCKFCEMYSENSDAENIKNSLIREAGEVILARTAEHIENLKNHVRTLYSNLALSIARKNIILLTEEQKIFVHKVVQTVEDFTESLRLLKATVARQPQLQNLIHSCTETLDSIKQSAERVIRLDTAERNQEYEFRAYWLTLTASIVTPLFICLEIAQTFPVYSLPITIFGVLSSFASAAFFAFFSKKRRQQQSL
ncbi:MAG: hypothetical protein N2654_04910 [Deltaproteobacteria bacterium]|nr:hypothetical protein [Deltaproteobacteria bacterium]